MHDIVCLAQYRFATETRDPIHDEPGVHVVALDSSRSSIDGVSTASAAFVGITRKGPTQKPVAIGQPAEYRAIFGSPAAGSVLSIAVQHYFANGGRTAHVVSVGHTAKSGRHGVRAADLVGSADDRTGVHALERAEAPPVGVLAVPDMAALKPREHATVAAACLVLCERHRMLCIIDPPSSCAGPHALERALEWAGRADALRHANAAIYFPGLEADDPSGRDGLVPVPASGAVAGVYARTHRQRGVWEAPVDGAGRLHGVVGVEHRLSRAQIRKLDRVGINALGTAPGGGLALLGGRTFGPNPMNAEWSYVNVRRLSLFIERSLHDGLQWVVFEPSDPEALAAQIRLQASSFLNHLWKAGALAGLNPREAYFVQCGQDTLTAADLEGGTVNVVVGFAPLKPAEFVVVQMRLTV